MKSDRYHPSSSLFFLYKIINHILKTQLSMEAFAVAAWRQLPSVHPVFKLLFPHLRSVMAINDFIRRAFLKTDASQVLLKKSYKTFAFKMLSLPQVLKEKGVDDVVKLPKFYYRYAVKHKINIKTTNSIPFSDG